MKSSATTQTAQSDQRSVVCISSAARSQYPVDFDGARMTEFQADNGSAHSTDARDGSSSKFFNTFSALETREINALYLTRNALELTIAIWHLLKVSGWRRDAEEETAPNQIYPRSLQVPRDAGAKILS